MNQIYWRSVERPGDQLDIYYTNGHRVSLIPIPAPPTEEGVPTVEPSPDSNKFRIFIRAGMVSELLETPKDVTKEQFLNIFTCRIELLQHYADCEDATEQWLAFLRADYLADLDPLAR